MTLCISCRSRGRASFLSLSAGINAIPASLIAEGPQASWHPAALIEAYAGIPRRRNEIGSGGSISPPLARNSTFADLIEDTPTAVKWHAAAHTNYILSLMSPLNRQEGV